MEVRTHCNFRPQHFWTEATIGMNRASVLEMSECIQSWNCLLSHRNLRLKNVELRFIFKKAGENCDRGFCTVPKSSSGVLNVKFSWAMCKYIFRYFPLYYHTKVKVSQNMWQNGVFQSQKSTNLLNFYCLQFKINLVLGLKK